jgi:hypothetical protein
VASVTEFVQPAEEWKKQREKHNFFIRVTLSSGLTDTSLPRSNLCGDFSTKLPTFGQNIYFVCSKIEQHNEKGKKKLTVIVSSNNRKNVSTTYQRTITRTIRFLSHLVVVFFVAKTAQFSLNIDI